MKTYEEQIRDIERSGYYQDVKKARLFMLNHLSPLWAPQLGLEPGSDVRAHLRLSDSVVLVAHFFARAVYGHGRSTKVPRLTAYPKWPGHERIRAVPKADIAAVTGLSVNQVEAAIRRMRPRSTTGERLYEAAIMHPYALPHGILLDLCTSLQGTLYSDVQRPISMEELNAAREHGYWARISGGKQPDEQMKYADRRLTGASTIEVGMRPAANDEIERRESTGT